MSHIIFYMTTYMQTYALLIYFGIYVFTVYICQHIYYFLYVAYMYVPYGKTHCLFSDSSKMSVMIQLFYDGLGVTNPLRGHSTLHNVGVFFYTIKNIPHRFNSCFANVHLLALCYSEDLKKYGFEPVLEKFVAEMNFLSRTGFTGTFPVIGEQTIYASLCQVTCDN